MYIYSVSNGFNNGAFDYNEAPVWLSLNMEAKNLGVGQSKIHNVSFWREKLLTKKNKIKTKFKIIKLELNFKKNI